MDRPVAYTNVTDDDWVMAEAPGDTAPRTVSVEPDWPRLSLWMADVIAQHGFERDSYESVAEYSKIVRSLSDDDFARLIEHLDR